MKKLLSVLFVGVAVLLSAQAADYPVTVPAGTTNVIDAAFVEALGSAERLVKRGTGVLQSSALMSAYTGEIVVEEGVLLLKETGSVGTSAGATVVSNGASVDFDLASTQNFRNETFKIAGFGAEGVDGALVHKGASMSGSDSSGFRYITLLDDAKIRSYSEMGLRAGNLYMNGHTLTIYERCTANPDGTGGSNWDYAFSFGRTHIRTPGHIIVEAGKISISSWSMGDSDAIWDGDATNTLTLKKNAKIVLSSTKTDIPWTLIVEDPVNTALFVSGNADSSEANNAWRGPIILNADFSLSYQQTLEKKGSMWLSGPISGVGGLTWNGYTSVHLKGHNTFEGQTSASGVGDNNNIPLFLHDGHALNPNGKGLKLTNGDLPLVAENAYELPAITFSNSDARSITGASAGGTMAGLVKTGAGTLTYDTEVSITGTLHVAQGRVLIPSISPREQAGGVMEGTRNFDTSGDADSVWNNYYSRQPPATEKRDSTRYPYLTAQPLWAEKAAGIRYVGYLWNNSATNETWSFMSGVQRRSRLYVGGKNVFSKNSWACQISAQYATFGQAVLKPGANEFLYYMEVSQSTTGGAGGSQLTTVVDFDGKVYSKPLENESTKDFKWVLYKGLAFNRYGSMSHDEADYEKFENLSAGTLMTVTNDFSHLAPKAKADVAKLVCDPDTVLDLSDQASMLEVDDFSGAGTISNGTIRVRSKMIVRSAFAGTPAVFAQAALEWKDGVTLEVDDIKGLDRTRHEDNPYVIAVSETPFTDVPEVSETLSDNRWRARLSADGKSIELYRERIGMMLLLR